MSPCLPGLAGSISFLEQGSEKKPRKEVITLFVILLLYNALPIILVLVSRPYLLSSLSCLEPSCYPIQPDPLRHKMRRDTERRRTMVNSFVWTAEEAKYLKAVLRWQDAPPNPEEERRLRAAAAAEEAERTKNKPQPAGEFRVLVIGARGTGKTSILTRVRPPPAPYIYPPITTNISVQFGNNTFRGEGEPPDPFYERGCRHRIDIDGTPYTIDALEMPSKHLLSNPMLEQALAITEAAILVYDVADPTTLSLAEGIADFMRETLSPSNPSLTNPPTTQREYALMLVGNKSDTDDEDRRVPWATGSKTAAALRTPTSTALSVPGAGTGCAFLEVSAKTGDNIDKIFPAVGREILRLKRLGQQRREQAERVARERAVAAQQAAEGPVRKKTGLWRILFFRRGHGHGQAVAAS